MNKYIFRIATFIVLVFFISSCSSKKTDPKTIPATKITPAVSSKTNDKNTPTGKIQFVNPPQFKKLLLLDNVQLVDVRTPEEFKTGHIKNASNIDVKESNFKANAKQLDKTKPVLVYCRSGKRSTDAAEILKEMGFSKIVSLEGGMISWEAADLPTNK